MQLAQRLYEGIEMGGDTVGLITYMRTDGVQMSQEAINAARQVIKAQFGGNFLLINNGFIKPKLKTRRRLMKLFAQLI